MNEGVNDMTPNTPTPDPSPLDAALSRLRAPEHRREIVRVRAALDREYRETGTIAMEPDGGGAVPRPEYVAARVRAWFAGREAAHGERHILQTELALMAQSEGIDIDAWRWSPAVAATGLKGVTREIWPGATAQCYVLETKGDDEP